MTQDNGGSERPQRTVAELLAEYGGNTDGAPRRRRRRAEDDGDSAPQTIIERVLSDSGKLLPIRDDQQPPRRAGGHRTETRRPVAQPPAQPTPPAQPAQAAPAQPPVAGQRTGYGEPVRPQQNPATRQQPPPVRTPNQQPAQQQFPPSRPAMQPVSPPLSPGPQATQQSVQPIQPAQPPTATSRPVAPPPTQQASLPGLPPVQQPLPQSVQSALPPSVPQTMQSMPPAVRNPPTIRRPPVDDTSATAVHPPLPDDYPANQPTGHHPPPTIMSAPLSARLGLSPEATTEEFPLVPDGPPPGPDGRTGSAPRPGPTQHVAPVGPPTGRRPTGPQPQLESTQAHSGPYVDDDYDDFGRGAGGHQQHDDVFPSRDDYDDLDGGPVDRLESFDGDEDDEPVGGREWLIMGAQVGAGAIAGAAVWLAFSWLWGAQPVIAVVAALAVIVGLVLVVRRWRRADDLQTTVLAILAGLVVTVSPAALLLLHR